MPCRTASPRDEGGIELRIRSSLFVLVLAGLIPASAATLDASRDLDTYPPLLLEGGTQNVATNSAGFYDFGDKNGDGTRDDPVVPAGLNMGNRSLYSDKENSSHIRLNLNGGDLISTNGNITTSNRRSTGNIVIRNVGTLSMGNGTLVSGWSGGGYGGDWNPNGSILIGQDGTEGPRAGDIQAASISSYTSWFRSAGDVVIHSSGDVLIKNSSGTPGSLESHQWNGSGDSGAIQIRHDGTFLAGNILALVAQGRANPGAVLLDGDTLNDGPSGTFTADLVDTHDRVLTWGAHPGYVASITIRNYAGVTLGSIDTRMKAGNGAAGSLSITGITGNVLISGGIDLDGYLTNGSSDGNLALEASGIIEVQDLDLDRVGTATFTSAKESIIAGVLSNFNTNNPAASGLVEGGGGNIYYNPEANPDLLTGGDLGRYALSSGVLKPNWPRPMLLKIR